MPAKPPLRLQTTTLWEYPSQHYGPGMQGDRDYRGATPSYVIWNLLERYTRPDDLVVDPMAGSGTTLDVAREMGRRALGYDVNPTREDIFNVDARKLPLKDAKVDFVFVDPPYSTHIDYSDDPRCIGKLDSAERAYYDAMEQVAREIHRVLKDRRYMALYVSDSYRKGKPFCPIGFELFAILRKYFKPVDIVAVVRHNANLKRGHWHKAAVEGNFFLRGFNYLLIMKKEDETVRPQTGKPAQTTATQKSMTPPPGGHHLPPRKPSRPPQAPSKPASPPPASRSAPKRAAESRFRRGPQPPSPPTTPKGRGPGKPPRHGKPPRR
ncbi:MAG TPA: DNA methyltransferase [Phycisphaerae bacterium]|nr:DNA methylase [Phycisphaerae bacterium]HOI55599.1 DNA methyltransferase [Phycisphaerae bacterium]